MMYKTLLPKYSIVLCAVYYFFTLLYYSALVSSSCSQAITSKKKAELKCHPLCSTNFRIKVHYSTELRYEVKYNCSVKSSVGGDVRLLRNAYIL